MPSARQTLPQRKEWAQRLPWITYMKRPRPCQGWVASASWRRGKETCKIPAHWRYVHSAKAMLFYGYRLRPYNRKALTKYYCWTHLISRGIYGDMYEDERTRKWFKDHPVEND